MKLRWRPAKGSHYLTSVSSVDMTHSHVFNSEEEPTIPVFRTENNMHLVLQYCEQYCESGALWPEELWKDVEFEEG